MPRRPREPRRLTPYEIEMALSDPGPELLTLITDGLKYINTSNDEARVKRKFFPHAVAREWARERR
jgi:hypothetical protein